MSNAIKYSKDDVEIKLDVSYEENLIIKVEDNGIGIPQNAIMHLFEAFFRAENAENIKGNGLGLSIVKSAVDLLNGIIEVESEVDIGTKFKATIPVSNKGI